MRLGCLRTPYGHHRTYSSTSGSNLQLEVPNLGSCHDATDNKSWSRHSTFETEYYNEKDKPVGQIVEYGKRLAENLLTILERLYARILGVGNGKALNNLEALDVFPGVEGTFQVAI
jgi:hypothetical protein